MENENKKVQEFVSENKRMVNPLALLHISFGSPKQDDNKVYNLDDVFAPIGQESSVPLRLAL